VALKLHPVCERIQSSHVTSAGIKRCLMQLQVLHELGYVHMDIRRPNLLFD
jgi:hypothetical protein